MTGWKSREHFAGLCVHDLTAAFCPDCQEAGISRKSATAQRKWLDAIDGQRDIPVTSYPWCRAKFTSRCPLCLTTMVEGDVLGLIDGMWLCQECADDASATENRSEVRDE